MVEFAIAAPLRMMSVGDEFPLVDWPLHVTIVPNAVIDGSLDDVAAALHEIATTTQPIDIEVAGHALFGPDGDIPVLLVQPEDELAALHHRVLDAGVALGARSVMQRFNRSGYRPHITTRPRVALARGDRLTLRDLVLIDVTDPRRFVVASESLDAGAPAPQPSS